MKKWIARFQKMTLDRKIKILLSIGIIASASIVLSISTFSAISSVTSKSKGLAQGHIETVSKSLDTVISNYYNIAISLIPDENVQTYLKKDTSSHSYNVARENILNSLSHLLFQQPDMNFIAINKSDSDYLYRGQLVIIKSLFAQKYREDLDNSKSSGRGQFNISINNVYSTVEDYSVTFYQPIYDMNEIGKIIGNFSINVKEEAFDYMYHYPKDAMELEMYLIDLDGNILLCEDKSRIGKKINLNHSLENACGDFMESGKLFVYNRIENTNMRVMGVIPGVELMRDSVITMSILVLAILLIVSVLLVMVSKVVKVYYSPLEKLVRKMELVSAGKLEVRMDERNVGEDFVTIAKGFNHMMEEMNQLVEQVKLEQHQVEQIKFDALQSQIKPHFLYNTLDCIHWQAAAEGNKEISTLVKALATYYRVCLSRGKDVISLEQELEHIKSYLIIQNMRYDNILESEINIKAQFYETKIPKMTLQPLIENALYHGLKIKEGKKGKVVLEAYTDEQFIIISVADDGNGMSLEEVEEMNNSISVYDESFGYGVRNVNKRIEILFGKEYGLYYQINEFGGVTVEVRLPRQQRP